VSTIRKAFIAIGIGILCVALLLVSLGRRTVAATQVNITTFHNDNARTGQNVSETTLTPSNVNMGQFGLLFSLPVDGFVFAQPLYISNLKISGVTHNVVFVATEHDGVYAFDGDTGTQLWYTTFINPGQGITTVSTGDVSCSNIYPEIGITGTPVIDPTTNSIYLVAKTKENGVFYQRLHVLDITTGLEKPRSPVVIQAVVHGTGQGSADGIVSFNPLRENQRPALMLQNGLLQIGWASHCDVSPYHAWVMAFNAKSYEKMAVWNSTTNGSLGGIWQSGDGLAGDASFNTYAATGNGTFDVNTGGVDYGDSIVKLWFVMGANVARVRDYFTPYNQAELSRGDVDLGSGGVVLLPDNPGGPNPHLLVQSGKEGSIYLINRDNMGHYNPNNNNQIVQFIPYIMGGIWGAPAWWNDSVYFSGEYDALKQFAFNTSTGLLSTSPVSQTSFSFSYPAAQPTISSNGTSDGILWAVDAENYYSQGPLVLYAYDATNLANEFYNSNQNTASPGNAVEYAVPTVANGKVYVGAEGQVSVFGLLP
jgi:hypothetical protein